MSKPLSVDTPDVEHVLGNTIVRYTICPRTGVVEFSCYPAALRNQRATPRAHNTGPHVDGLPEQWRRNQFAHEPEWLVQYHLAGSIETGGFQIGFSMRGSPDLAGLSFEVQEMCATDTGTEIHTLIRHRDGYRLRHVVRWAKATSFFRVATVFENTSHRAHTIEFLPSFSLGGITPFDQSDAAERLYLHRFRSNWSAEGRHERLLLESLNLEPSWTGHARRSERFGQIGTLPVRQFFPWIGLEDEGTGVIWGAHLSAPGSWHLECSRLKDRVVLSGGLPSRDFGEWWKTVAPGESFATPEATLACVQGGIDDLCHALTAAQIEAVEQQPAIERELPIIFNEWCTSWGHPTHHDMLKTARLLQDSSTKIMVIDDGWAVKPKDANIQCNGDWDVDREKFPDGLGDTTKAMRALGMIPGLWFEWEVANQTSKAFAREDLQLKRNGAPIQVGSRHFWDMRSPGAVAYLAEKVIRRLKDDGFGYLKIDYNDSLPAGVDGEESPGEELRKHLAGVHSFIRRIREEIPDIIIENCSSGGHRLEPSFMGLCAMGSFSDAHETWSIPIIAANLHRLILPRQNQIWCVLHPTDTQARIRYGLAATLLGRMALSGDLANLSNEQLMEVRRAQDFYEEARDIIRDGRSRLTRETGASWNHPRGWQALIREGENGELLVVVHTFELHDLITVQIPLPPGVWRVADHYHVPVHGNTCQEMLSIEGLPAFFGGAVRLQRDT